MESLALLTNYFSIEDPTGFDPVDRELDMLEDLDGITIRGILDRIDRDDDGRLVITDYKTGKAPPERPLPLLRPQDLCPSHPTSHRRDAQGASPSLSERAHHVQARHRRPPTRCHGLTTCALERHRPGPRHAKLPHPAGTLCNWCSFKEICPAFTGRSLPGEDPRTSLASATLRIPLMRAAVLRSTSSLMAMLWTSLKARVMISRRRATTSFSVQKYFWTSWTHSK